jgi:hypothetical protein
MACQKSHDMPAAETQQAEIMTTTAGEVAMESAASDCGQFRTQTQGGWGTNPHGNNPGVYLQANFSAAFPAGLHIGCPSGGYSVYYTSAHDVSEFLPAGGPAGVLAGNATNPASKSIKNVLVGQLTALALSVGFDYYDLDFGPAHENLGNLIISNGPFAGRSVSEFLALANSALGGCAPGTSFTELNHTASLINENFVDGNTDGGFLTCPTVRFTER